MPKTLVIILIIVGSLFFMAFALPYAGGLLSTLNPNKALEMAQQKKAENSLNNAPSPIKSVTQNTKVIPTTTPQPIEFSLVGIWQASSSMAAGWNDRYHFYPSGTFVYYPSEMGCLNQKTTKIGTWKLDKNSLNLIVTKTVERTYQCNREYESTLTDSNEIVLTSPKTEKFTFINQGLKGDDIYPSISLNGKSFWKFNDDPTSYVESNIFPEPSLQ